MITKEDLIKCGVSDSNSSKYVEYLNNACIKFNINTNSRCNMFLAQILHESNNFNVIKENLNYTPQRLLEVFPIKFKDLEDAQACVNNKNQMIERIYGGRMGNPAGESYKYIGRGLIQITGYNNYKACKDALKIDFIKNPELLENPEYACMSAAWFFSKSGCNSVADNNNLESFKQVTRIINGGIIGLDDRISKWNKVKQLNLTVEYKIEENKEVSNPSTSIQKPNILQVFLSIFNK